MAKTPRHEDLSIRFHSAKARYNRTLKSLDLDLEIWCSSPTGVTNRIHPFYPGAFSIICSDTNVVMSLPVPRTLSASWHGRENQVIAITPLEKLVRFAPAGYGFAVRTNAEFTGNTFKLRLKYNWGIKSNEIEFPVMMPQLP